nr:Ger(x)C family spore germination protein [Bacilli bacterium]
MNNLFKKTTIANILVVCLTFMVNGCYDAAEVNQLAIITASSVDLNTRNGKPNADPSKKYLKSLQISIPNQLQSSQSGSSGGSSGSASATFIVVSGVNASPTSAMISAQEKLSRRFFLADRRVIILGEAYAKTGISTILDELVRNPQARLHVYILIAKGTTGKKIIEKAYPLNRLPSDAIVELEESHSFVAVDAVRFIRLMTEGSDAYAMGIRLLQHAKSSSIPFLLDHIAVFHRDRMVGWLSPKESKGFLLLYDHANEIQFFSLNVQVPPSQQTVTFRVTQLLSSVQPILQHGKLQLMIKLFMKLYVIENGTADNFDHPDAILRLQKCLTQHMQKDIQVTLFALQKRLNVDCLQIGRRVHAFYPTLWHTLSPKWRQVFATLPYKINLNFQIINSGNGSAPIHLRQPPASR